MQVREVMCRDVVTVDVGTSLRDAAHEMLSNRVGSVVVTVDGTPAGILTEYDLVWAGYKADLAFSEIPVRKVASQPLKTIRPGATLRTAADQMKRMNVTHLVVSEKMSLEGIVTMTDFVHHHSAFAKDAQNIEARRDEWTSK